MSPSTLLDETIRWLETLPGDFAFLLALPFLVAGVAFAGATLRGSRGGRAVSRSRAPRPGGPEGPSRRDRHRPA